MGKQRNDGRVRMYCWRSGLIGFGEVLPDGCLPIVAHSDEQKLRMIAGPIARHAYKGSALIVPGIPEAATTEQALDALEKFRQLVLDRLGAVS